MIAYTLPSLVAPLGTIRTHIEGQLLAQAHRIAENRTVAGVHFPVDSLAGQTLAKALADYFLWQCGVEIPVCPQVVNPGDAQASADFTQKSFTANVDNQLTVPALEINSPLRWIAKAASGEWT